MCVCVREREREKLNNKKKKKRVLQKGGFAWHKQCHLSKTIKIYPFFFFNGNSKAILI